MNSIISNHLLFFLYVLILLCYIVKSVSIKNESDLLSLFNKNDNQSNLIINIDSEIQINNNIKIENSFEKISFIGNDKDTSKLVFSNEEYQLYFTENVKEIEFKNLSIKENLFFDNNINVSFDTVNIYGSIDSNFEKNNEKIYFLNVSFTASNLPTDFCVNLSGNIEIDNSIFLGNKACQKRLFHFNGLDKYKLDIKNSYYNGNYECPLIRINNGKNVELYASYFDKGYINIDDEEDPDCGGAGIKIANSQVYIHYCTFRDIFSEYHAAVLELENTYSFTANSIEAFNCTSTESGSFAHISSEYDNNSKVYFKNITQIDTGVEHNIKNGGTIMVLRKNANVDVNLYYAENLKSISNCGNAFNIRESSKIDIKNVEINKIRTNCMDSVFINTLNPNYPSIKATNVTINDAYQSKADSGILFWLNEKSQIELYNIKVNNAYGPNPRFFYAHSGCGVKIDGLEVNNFESKTYQEFMVMYTSTKENAFLHINNLKLNNIQIEGALIRSTNYIDFEITNSEIKNINPCHNRREECKIMEDLTAIEKKTSIFFVGKESKMTIRNTIFENIKGNRGLTTYKTGQINIYDSTFKNCYFDNGLIEVDSDNIVNGNYLIENTHFYNITSPNGSILNIKTYGVEKDDHEKYMNYKMEEITGQILFKNSIFENNIASELGGVVYSVSTNTQKYVNFEQCEFKNNTALIGNVCFSLTQDNEPNFSNREELINNKGLATNPTKLELSEDYDLQIYSGDKIPYGVSCKMYDDYDNLIIFDSDISKFDIHDMISFNVDTTDDFNVEVYGQSKSYCWEDKCEFPPVKVIGNPGDDRVVRLSIMTFGKYNTFENNYIDLNLKIKDCEDDYIFQNVESSRIKSCYQPICSPSCNNGGKCVNNNVCNCNGTLHVGQFCDEHLKLERNKNLDISLKVIISILITITVITAVMVVIYRHHPVFKAAAYDLMLLILLGVFINLIYAYYLTEEKTTIRCYIQFIFNNIGFSLVFVTIVVKLFRIFRIFCYCTGTKRAMKQPTMYIMILSFTSFYVVVSIIWIACNQIKLSLLETKDSKEYKKCVLPRANILCTMINFFVLALGCYLSYALRRVDPKFKEDLAIPVYVYVLFTTLIQIVNFNDEISIVVQDLFGTIGTIINNFIILLYLYIFKFYTIYVRVTIEESRSKLSIQGSNDKLADQNMKFKSQSLAGFDNKNKGSNDSLANNIWKSNSASSVANPRINRGSNPDLPLRRKNTFD